MSYNRRSVKVVTSTDDPIWTIAEIKDLLRVTGADDDAKLEGYVVAATEAIKQRTRQALRTETLRLTLDGFSDDQSHKRLMALGGGTHDLPVSEVFGNPGTVELPFGPVESITSVVTYDRANTASTLTSAAYGLEDTRIYLNDGYTWPSDLRRIGGVEITYVAGFGSASVPRPIVEAIGLYVEQLYEGCAGMTDQIEGLLGGYLRMDGLSFGAM